MDEKKKSTKLYHSLTTVGFMIAVMFTGIVIYDAGPHIPLVFACMGAGLVALWIGYSWDEILDAPATKVFMKSGRLLGELRDKLEQRGELDRASMVANCGLPDERVYPWFADAREPYDYFSVVIVKEA